MSALLMRIAGLEGYKELVEELGGDSRELIKESELEVSWFDTPDHLIPAWKACKLLEISANALGCPDFGLRLAKRQKLSMLGPLGIMLQHSETLEQVLQDLKRFLHVHSQAGSVDLAFNGKFVNITYTPLVFYQGQAKQLTDMSIAYGFFLLSQLANRKFPLVSVYFSHKKSPNNSIYEDYFGCPIIFGATENGVTVSRKALEGTLTQDREGIRGFLSSYLQDQQNNVCPSLEESARIIIRQLLPLGKCKLDFVSAALSIEKRTLQRRLKELNTSFQSIVEDERKRLATKYLNETDMDMAQIADLLGYAEPSVYCRSFKSWFGITPTEYIKQEQIRWQYKR